MQYENDTVRVDSIKLWGAFSFVVLISFFCFIPDLYNKLLLWDDSQFIVENSHIRNLTFDTISWAFTEFHSHYWAPLTWLSFAIDYALWGLNPVGYHLTNNILHALNTGCFFLLSYHLLQQHLTGNHIDNENPPLFSARRALSCSILAALFFSLHPLRVESVAWATERKDVLSMFFGIPAMLAYLRYTRKSCIREHSYSLPSIIEAPLYWLSLLLFCLSLLSKSMLVTLPVVMLVLDWFPLRRLRRTTIKQLFFEKVPFMVPAVIASTITSRAIATDIKTFEQIDLVTRILVAFDSLTDYMQLTVWPLNISPVYLHPGNIGNIRPEYLVPVIIFFGITAFCVYTVRRRPVYLAVWVIYLITLLPVIGLVQAGPQSMAGRFTYLPSLGISMLVALGITAVGARVSRFQPALFLLISGSVLLLMVNSYITVRDIRFWKDDVTLWTRVIDVQPREMGLAYIFRSLAFEKIGEHQKALGDISKAFAIAERKNYKGIHEIYYVRARVLKNMGDPDGAIADLGRAIEISTYPKNHFYYMERGMLYEQQGKSDLAAEDFRIATTADQAQ